MNAIGWTEKQSLFRLFPLIISISFAMDVFVPAIPDMSLFFNTDSATMQASLYVFMLTVALGQLLTGPLADHFGRRAMAIASAILFVIGSVLSILSTSVHALILARMIQAAGACGTYLLCFIMIRDNFSTQTCGRLFSILCGTNSMVASTAPVIGGILLEWTGDWHSGFYFLAFLGVLMSIIAFCYIPAYSYKKSQDDVGKLQLIKNILDNPDFNQYSLIAASCLLGLYLFCALSPGILITQLQLKPTEYGLWFGLNAMTVFVANMMAARLTYSFSLERIVQWGVCLMICSCLLMTGLNYFQTTVLRFMLPMLSLTVGIGLSMGSATALALKDFENQAGTATAVLGFCQISLAGLLGILVAQFRPDPLSLTISVGTFSLFGLFRIKSYTGKVKAC